VIQNYVFIDGAYLRRAYEDSMRQFFDNVDPRNLEFSAIKNSAGASKAFYYDCVDDNAPDAEDRRKHLEAISALDGFHVREGTLSGDRKRQKQVDIQLAVECLTHAFHKNVWHVSLIAGDLDFKPLVDALIDLGVHVHVFYEPKSAARKLYRAADVAVPVDLTQFWNWSSPAYQAAQPIPSEVANTPPTGDFLLRKGSWRDRAVELYEHRSKGLHLIYVHPKDREYSREVSFRDRERLERYFNLKYGSISWAEKP
jgi:uncharacterized LabA/DUF88 family protein